MNENKKKKISKFLSLVLRHAPETIDLELDKNGWASTAELIDKCKPKFSMMNMEILREVVQTNDKQRFAFGEKEEMIRANQGHSVKSVDIALEPKEPPYTLYHGTATKNMNSILKDGIDKRGRQHVHLSDNIETAQKVGSRHGVPVILKIDAYRMKEDGVVFYLSNNGVWLTDYIAPNYIKQ